MWTRVLVLALSAGAIGGCAGRGPAVRAPAEAAAPRTLHRPPWTRAIPQDLDTIARCLEGRETPAYALIVYHDPRRLTAVTTVDTYESLEHCLVDDGRVVERRPGAESLRDFEGLPLFSLGPVRPQVAGDAHEEEVVSEGHVLGWLYWPAEQAGNETPRVESEARESVEDE